VFGGKEEALKCDFEISGGGFGSSDLRIGLG
jgi:hypothetical protein